jgi:NADPH2:quinone reductase
VIYDPVGGALFDQCMRCISWYGRVLVIGFAAGDIPRVPINLILLKSCQVVGVFFGAWSARFRDEARQNFEEILELYEAGRIDPLVGREYPLEDYARALDDLAERRAIGKVVVRVR